MSMKSLAGLWGLLGGNHLATAAAQSLESMIAEAVAMDRAMRVISHRLRTSATPSLRSSRAKANRYEPHQGQRECARRENQMVAAERRAARFAPRSEV